MRRGIRWALTLGVVALVRTAAAADPADAQEAARALFDDARRLMHEGHFAAACPKLEAARDLYASAGVLLNLGDCYEKTGRAASAWSSFGEAVRTAADTGRADFEAEARRRKAALEPTLSRLAVRVEHERPGLEVRRDGKPIDRAARGVAVPVDAGVHQIEARAGGRLVWSVSVPVSTPGATVTLEVPDLRSPGDVALLPAPTSTVASVANPAGPRSIEAPVTPAPHGAFWSAQRTTGAAMAGLGVLGIGASVGLLLAAESRFAGAEGTTGSPRVDQSGQAVGFGDAASFAFVVGTAMVAGGAVLWFTAARGAPTVGTNGREVLLHGAF
jgi:hypothetical protein